MIQNITETIIVPLQKEKRRLSDIAADLFKSLPSRKSIKKAVKKGLVRVDGSVGYTGDFILGGEVLELIADEEKVVKPVVNIPLKVIYEDDFLAIINKSAGILVSGNKRLTLENALPLNLKPACTDDALSHPEPIHRLDYPTSGALLVGKTRESVISLNKIFEERRIQKKYLAVTIGEMPFEGVVEKEVEDKPAKSAWRVLQRVKSPRFSFLNLVELTLFTGRRHQLRIHMASLGHPILGDANYGIEGLILKGKGLYLHSYSLEFKHPQTDESFEVKVPVPGKFLKIFPSLIC
jgi:23S rRNA pseudouridine1911/1915/1917 synthase